MLNRAADPQGPPRRRPGHRTARRTCCRWSAASRPYLGFSYADRLHIATHHHNDPLVPRSRVHGVRGPHRPFRQRGPAAARGGRPRGCQRAARRRGRGIVISLIFSYRNPAHEQRVREIVEEEKAKRSLNGNCPVFVSSELYPSRRDFPRLNTTVIEAYAAEPSRGTLPRGPRPHQGARRRLRAAGDGEPRRHDLDRRRPARDHPWSPARSAASSAPAGWPTGSTSTTSSAPTSAAPRSTSPC